MTLRTRPLQYCSVSRSIAVSFYTTQACRKKLTIDFLICASCHRAGHYKHERAVEEIGCPKVRKHLIKDGNSAHTQFTFRMRFWSEEALCKKKKDLDLELEEIYKEDESWHKKGEKQSDDELAELTGPDNSSREAPKVDNGKEGVGRSNDPSLRTVESIWQGFQFYVGKVVVAEISETIGQVHDVEGDGNCGFYCLVMALAMFPIDYGSIPKDQSSMRKLLKEEALPLQVEIFEKMSIFSLLDDDEALDHWNANIDALFQEGIDYDSSCFMKRLAGGKYVNDKHWMDGDFALCIFSKVYKLRVALYIGHKDEKRTSWTTHLYDGRNGTVDSNHYEGLQLVYTCERTFGMYFDGVHYQYIVI